MFHSVLANSRVLKKASHGHLVPLIACKQPTSYIVRESLGKDERTYLQYPNQKDMDGAQADTALRASTTAKIVCVCSLVFWQTAGVVRKA